MLCLLSVGYFYALDNGIFAGARFSPIFRFLLVSFDRTSAWLSLGVCLLAASWKNATPIFRLVDLLARHPIRTSIAVVPAMSICATLIYHRTALSMDEYAAIFQSKVFASWHITACFPPDLIEWLIAPGFNGRFLVASPDTGQAIEAYWPGFSILLSPFQMLGIPWLCNPLLAGLSLYLIYRLTLEITQCPRAGGFAMLFALGSGAYDANAISFYSMQAHATANLLFVWLMIKPSRSGAMVAGIVGSFALVLHNPFPHTLFALPWVAAMAIDKEQRKCLPYLVTGYLPLSFGLGVGWFALRGIIQPHFSLMPTSDFHLFRWPNNAMLDTGFASMVKAWVWAVPGLFLLAGLGFVRCREHRSVQLLALSSLLTFAGYFFVSFDQGHGWGYRYFHSAWPAIPILAACGVQGSRDMPWRLAPFAGAAAIMSLLIIVPFQLSRIDKFIVNQHRQLPAVKRPGNNVFFVPLDRGFYLPDMIQVDPFLKDRDLFLVSHGEAANFKFVKKHWPNAVRIVQGTQLEQWYLGDIDERIGDTENDKRFVFTQR